jgi:HTH-type transcriptional regulator / antitoxin HigA
MEIRPIRTEADYDAALKEIEPYFKWEPEPGSPEADRFDVLAALIAAYERERWPVAPPPPTRWTPFVIAWSNKSIPNRTLRP